MTRRAPPSILGAVDLQSALVVAAILTVLALVAARAAPRTRRALFVILPLPTAIVLWRWAAYRAAWAELAAGLALAAALTALWWAAIGRRLPPPRESTIRVWTPEDEA